MNDCITNHPELCCKLCTSKSLCSRNGCCDMDGMDINWNSFKLRQEMYGHNHPMSSLRLVAQQDSKQ